MTHKKPFILLGREVRVVRKKDFVRPQPNPALFEDYDAVPMKYGCIGLVAYILAIAAGFFLGGGITVRYAAYIREVLVVRLGAAATVCMLLALLGAAAIVTMVAHEFFHFIALPQGGGARAEVVLHLNLPLGIGFVNSECLGKRRAVFLSLCPLVFLSALLGLCAVVVENSLAEYILLMAMAVNVVSSGIDVIRAGYIMLKTPKNAKICLGYAFVPRETVGD